MIKHGIGNHVMPKTSFLADIQALRKRAPRGSHSQNVSQEFLDHSNEKLGHADQIAERIVQLGGAPDFAPHGLTSRMVEGILAVEEEHADELAHLLVAFRKESEGKRRSRNPK